MIVALVALGSMAFVGLEDTGYAAGLAYSQSDLEARCSMLKVAAESGELVSLQDRQICSSFVLIP